MKWHPIETAPKDGSNIIGYNGEDVAEMVWEDWPDDNRHVGWCRAGFESGGMLYETHNRMEPEPTHWMPLPKPPDVRKEGRHAWLDNHYVDFEAPRFMVGILFPDEDER